jgi:hypothetical protein
VSFTSWLRMHLQNSFNLKVWSGEAFDGQDELWSIAPGFGTWPPSCFFVPIFGTWSLNCFLKVVLCGPLSFFSLHGQPSNAHRSLLQCREYTVRLDGTSESLAKGIIGICFQDEKIVSDFQMLFFHSRWRLLLFIFIWGALKLMKLYGSFRRKHRDFRISTYWNF